MSFTLLNGICWVAFVLVWVMGALYNAFNAPATVERRFRYDWLIFSVAAWLVMRAPARYVNFMTFRLEWLQGVGAVVLVLFTLFTLWSRFVLGKMWAANAQVKIEHQLVTNGPYRVTRHPIYTGILGMILGSALSLGQGMALIGFLAALIFFKFRIYQEEQLMTRTFGDAYTQYKKRVPQLVPGLKFGSKD